MLCGHMLAPVYLSVFFNQLRMFLYESPWNVLPNGFYYSVMAVLFAMSVFNVLVMTKRFILWLVNLFNVDNSSLDLKINKVPDNVSKAEQGAYKSSGYNPLDNFSNPPHPGNISNIYYESYYGDD